MPCDIRVSDNALLSEPGALIARPGEPVLIHLALRVLQQQNGTQHLQRFTKYAVSESATSVPSVGGTGCSAVLNHPGADGLTVSILSWQT